MVPLPSPERVRYAVSRASMALNQLEKTLLWLDADPQSEERWGRLDATAKRFEIAFEYVWKALKLAIDYSGDEVFGPRDAINLAIIRGWIASPDTWAAFLQARNAGVHDYFGMEPEEYAAVAKDFLVDARVVLSRIPV
ncbi:MAG: nucleotidyltransferase substrate binding protein [Ignavibacteria bacterium]|nr:nucleotidyltransferase substrate binding protein [Ignavibacteria bacterium]